MIKKNLKTMIITSIIILLPIIVGILLWNQLPAELATHFGLNGKPDGWTSKGLAVFGLPLLLLLLHWFCACFVGVDPKKANISDKIEVLILWLVPVISIVGNGSTYLYALDNSINTTSHAMMFLGCIFLVLGNYLPKMKQSYTIGFKLPWTLESEENWNRTHRLAGWIMMVSGCVILIANFFELYWLMGLVVALSFIVPVIYSFILFKQGV